MKHMNGVHSRIGVTFTALVEIAVSTITSLSVCALAGFQITMVPWYLCSLSSLSISDQFLSRELLPIVIVFVGAENMFNLVSARPFFLAPKIYRFTRPNKGRRSRQDVGDTFCKTTNC